jgi:cell division protein ZapB
MDAELNALEERVRRAAELCRLLRDENLGLRQQVARLEDDKRSLSERMDGARDRLESVLKQLPE